ncbi:MAG: hypothetical protein ACYDCM_07150 [Candidatus Acidiferrales bacterium]
MTYALDVKNESLAYQGTYSRPAFEFWGQGGTIAKGLYNALSPYGASLANIQPNSLTPSAADTVFTVLVGQHGVCKFMLDKIELSFANFTEEFFWSTPKILEASTSWIREAAPSLGFALHHFTYFSHSLLKTGRVEEFLKTVNPTSLKSAGSGIGNGVVFNHMLPDRNWLTQIVLDRSALISGGIYISLMISVKTDFLNYVKMLSDARTYLAGVLGELNLTLPELSE